VPTWGTPAVHQVNGQTQLIVNGWRHIGAYDFKTEVLVASVRHPGHVIQAGLLGADVCTLPSKVFEQMLKHPLTDKGVEQFLKDWEKVPVIK